MYPFDVTLSDDDSWCCEHVNDNDFIAASEKLTLLQTEPLITSPISKLPERRSVNCPKCGTYWRIWMRERIARPAIEFARTSLSYPRLYRRRSGLDIDRVISVVSESLPTVIVTQNLQPHVGDDDGLWWFRLPDVHGDVQIESSTWMCPFTVENSFMASAKQATTAMTVREAAQGVLDYFRKL